MKFAKAQPNEIYQVHRWLSEGGRWEAGLQPMMFGVRVQVALVGSCGPTLNYCAGPDPRQIMLLMGTVLGALEQFDEGIRESELGAAFPGYEIKPVFFDPVCWPRLQEMAKVRVDENFARSA